MVYYLSSFMHFWIVATDITMWMDVELPLQSIMAVDTLPVPVSTLKLLAIVGHDCPLLDVVLLDTTWISAVENCCYCIWVLFHFTDFHFWMWASIQYFCTKCICTSLQNGQEIAISLSFEIWISVCMLLPLVVCKTQNWCVATYSVCAGHH
jgi:hypothetical protein